MKILFNLKKKLKKFSLKCGRKENNTGTIGIKKSLTQKIIIKPFFFKKKLINFASFVSLSVLQELINFQVLYEIMLQCWHKESEKRPTFETLHWKLEDLFSNDGSEYKEAIMSSY